VKRKFIKIWNDPVISGLTVFIITLLYNRYEASKDNLHFFETFKSFWLQPIPLWVLGIFLALIPLSYKIYKTKKFQYDSETLKLDQNLYLKIRDELLTDEMILNVKENVFSSISFKSESLFEIIEFRYEDKYSYFEFLNPTLEYKKDKLVASIVIFHEITSGIISSHHGYPDHLSIPTEWSYKFPDRLKQARLSISNAENEIAECYDDFRRTAKKILKV
jgi:hypothetical protein